MNIPRGNKWQRFERLVAAIHKAETQGASITWNDKINGRQFDVTLRFEHGLYEYLTVIECKDHKSAIKVTDVEAFVTKSSDVNANKGVIVSSSGFQQGCYDVARRYDIGLYTLMEVERVPEEYLTADITPAIQIYDIMLHESELAATNLRDEGGSLSYYTIHTAVITPKDTRPLLEWLHGCISMVTDRLTSSPRDCDIRLPHNSHVRLPHNDGKLPVSHITFKCALVEARLLSSPIDPSLVPQVYSYKDELTGTEKTIIDQGLGLGHDTVLKEGSFYISLSLSFYYYCKSVDGEIARLILIESYQLGTLIQADFTQDTRYAANYIEVTDEKTLRRLKYLLEHLDNEGEGNGEVNGV